MTVDDIVNEQFKIIGVNVKFEDIPEKGIKVKNKYVKWFDYYKFKDEEEYLKWKRWALIEMDKMGTKEKFDELDMLYGLSYNYPKDNKKDQLELF